LALLACAGWLSHLLLDVLGADTAPPIGLMALWPLSDAYIKSPWTIFGEIGRNFDWATVEKNTRSILRELVLLLPLLWAASRARHRVDRAPLSASGSSR
jgi:hypothetical protein